MKKLLSILLIFGMIFSLAGVLAQGNRYIATEKVTEQALETVQNAFQNRYQYNCSGNCSYTGFGENIKLQVQENKRIQLGEIGFNLPIKEEYTLDNEGRILERQRNIWSRIFGGTL